MTFFNKKEEVLSIELTPYGRHLLSLGKLKPKYYSFFDDDITYNYDAAGVTEDCSQIKDRILSDTPYLKPSVNFESDEDTIRQSETYLSTEEISFPSTNDKIYFLNKPLGTSDYNSRNSCALRATFIQNEIASSSKFITNITGGTQQVPQISVDFRYDIKIKNENEDTSRTNASFLKPEIRTTAFADGSYFDITPDKMIVQLLEENGFNLIDNFEIEVFKVEEDNSNKMQQLKFLPKKYDIENNILVDNSVSNYVEPTTDYVEYYFDIFVDEEISVSDICEGVARLKSNDVIVDLEIVCPDFKDENINIYTSRVTDIEVCD